MSFESSSSGGSFDLSSSLDDIADPTKPYQDGPMPVSSFRKLTNPEMDRKIASIFNISIASKNFLGEELFSPTNPFNTNKEN